jgi:hypothetical protein
MASHHNWPDHAVVTKVLEQTTNWDAAAKQLGVPRTTLQAHCKKFQLGNPGKAVGDRTSLAVTERELGDIRKLIERRGLNPDEFELLNIRLNEWGRCSSCDTAQEQNRVDLKPRRDVLFPARSDGWRPPTDKASTWINEDGLTVLMGDFHAPEHDENLLACAVEFVRVHRPERIIFMGDLMDYGSTVSRHKSTGFEPSLQENVDQAYGIIRAFAQASPGTKLTSLDGNHEQRMNSALESRGLIPLAHLTQAEGGEAVLSSRHLLRLDELGCETVPPPVEGYDYSYCETQVCDGLVARHGYLSKTGAGASVLEHVKKLSRSLAIGHCHRLAIVYHSTWPDGELRQLIGIECGTMAKTRHGMGYATSAPDWQQGFSVVQRHANGFTADLAPYIGGTLRWRDWSTTA